jgi:hypothetical protein
MGNVSSCDCLAILFVHLVPWSNHLLFNACIIHKAAMERTELGKQRDVELTRIAGKQLEKDLEKHAMAKEASLFC